jgi:G3E family GTPase
MTRGTGVQVNMPMAVPVTVITGFLGSGKTTVLNRLLRAPDLSDTAVIINEFGEVSLDHLLIEQAIENAVLLKNGCICCTVRGDIADTLTELFRRRDSGELPWFSRIAIETTGLADPAPVVHSILDSGQNCRLDGIVVTVDAVHAVAQLAQQTEAQNQVGLADRILLTKTDLVSAAQEISVERAIRRFNAGASIRAVSREGVRPEDVFGLGAEPGADDARLARWLQPAAHAHDHDHHHHDPHHGISSVVVRAEIPIAADALSLWLDSVLSLQGQNVLRLKGIVALKGESRLLVLQAVHHVLHPAVWLPEAARNARGAQGTEIVVIHRGLPARGLQASFDVVLERCAAA